MTTYQLSIDIDQAGLSAIYTSGQRVTLVKSVTSFPGSTGNLPVAWISFNPMEGNLITWTENYSVYATTTQIAGGAQIVMSSSTPAQEGIMYALENGAFSNIAGGAPSVYNVKNMMEPGNFNFGLAQDVEINGVPVSAPVSASPVLYNETATFTPIETISVFLTSYTNNGVVITQVASNACTIILTSQNPTASLTFQDSTNTFIQNASAPLTVYDLVQKRLQTAA